MMPRNRCETRGLLPEFKADCTNSFKMAMRSSDTFYLTLDDFTEVVSEWSIYLTSAEISACFRAAKKD